MTTGVFDPAGGRPEVLTDWNEREDLFGTYLERFDRVALMGVDVALPFRFRVLRESWDDSGEVPRRTIHAIELIG